MAPFRKGKETPAEQLLRMIEGSQGQPEAAAKPAAVPGLRRLSGVMGGLGAGIWRRVLPSHREADAFLWNLRVANRVIWAALALLGAYVVADLLMSKGPARPAEVTTAAGSATGASGAGEAPRMRSLSEYLMAVKVRNPFTGETADSGSQTSPQTAKRQLQEMSEGLVIVGIDRGANPIALVESTTQKRTYMLRVGDDVNGMKVKKIDADGVLVTYEGEELRLK